MIILGSSPSLLMTTRRSPWRCWFRAAKPAEALPRLWPRRSSKKHSVSTHGYDPGPQPMDPAIGNFKPVEAINFKDNTVPQRNYASVDQETSDHVSDGTPILPTMLPDRTRKNRISARKRTLINHHREPEPAQAQRRQLFRFFPETSRNRNRQPAIAAATKSTTKEKTLPVLLTGNQDFLLESVQCWKKLSNFWG